MNAVTYLPGGKYPMNAVQMMSHTIPRDINTNLKQIK